MSEHDPKSQPKAVKKKQSRHLGVVSSESSAHYLETLLSQGHPFLSASNSWRPHRPIRPDRSADQQPFSLSTDLVPSGDQPQAIDALTKGIQEKVRDQVLLGVTGSGKTFTMANIIARVQRPTLVLAPNKTLAAQLYDEFKHFFPNHAVEYFVSYYDYYQPEAYVPRKDLFIEKDSSINEQIDRLRHAATQALLERNDVIVVASVSCIYGIGSVETYSEMSFMLTRQEKIDHQSLLRRMVTLQYVRTQTDLSRGTFRVVGDQIDLWPSHLDDAAWRISLWGNEIESIIEFDPLTGQKRRELHKIKIYANNHYVTPRVTVLKAIKSIKDELRVRLNQLKDSNRYVEAQRLEQRCLFDLEMLESTGFCSGIENYSRYLTGRAPGEPPPTLFEYLPEDALLFVDESHVAVPQIHGMFSGDFRRKATLVEYGFRLPSCLDNRPLRFEEWDRIRPQTIFVSATPGPWEVQLTHGEIVEQVIRPTGLLDPIVKIRPAKEQVFDLHHELLKVIAKGYRVLVTTLTKRTAEDLSSYLSEQGIKVQYMHSDIDTLERLHIIRDLRIGTIDVLIGINLLREGLDIPECGLVAILDADKEGFLRSTTSLIQTIGRAARNVDGYVILYADHETESIKKAIGETNRRRQKQIAHNKEFDITPKSTYRRIANVVGTDLDQDETNPILELDNFTSEREKETALKTLKKKMRERASALDFESAARLRDQIRVIEHRNS